MTARGLRALERHHPVRKLPLLGGLVPLLHLHLDRKGYGAGQLEPAQEVNLVRPQQN